MVEVVGSNPVLPTISFLCRFSHRRHTLFYNSRRGPGGRCALIRFFPARETVADVTLPQRLFIRFPTCRTNHEDTRHANLDQAFLTVAACLFSVCFRSEEHTSELQSLMRISYAVFCLKKKITTKDNSSK